MHLADFEFFDELSAYSSLYARGPGQGTELHLGNLPSLAHKLKPHSLWSSVKKDDTGFLDGEGSPIKIGRYEVEHKILKYHKKPRELPSIFESDLHLRLLATYLSGPRTRATILAAHIDSYRLCPRALKKPGSVFLRRHTPAISRAVLNQLYLPLSETGELVKLGKLLHLIRWPVHAPSARFWAIKEVTLALDSLVFFEGASNEELQTLHRELGYLGSSHPYNVYDEDSFKNFLLKRARQVIAWLLAAIFAPIGNGLWRSDLRHTKAFWPYLMTELSKVRQLINSSKVLRDEVTKINLRDRKILPDPEILVVGDGGPADRLDGIQARLTAWLNSQPVTWYHGLELR